MCVWEKVNNFKSDMREKNKINKLFTGLGSVCAVKNCDIVCDIHDNIKCQALKLCCPKDNKIPKP